MQLLLVSVLEHLCLQFCCTNQHTSWECFPGLIYLEQQRSAFRWYHWHSDLCSACTPDLKTTEHLRASSTAHSWLSLCRSCDLQAFETWLSEALGVHIPAERGVYTASTWAFKIINNLGHSGLLFLTFIFSLSDCKMEIKHFAFYFAEHVSVLLVRR